jgi:phosphatidylglycerol:prolipoprotein diacylglycerol transferase
MGHVSQSEVCRAMQPYLTIAIFTVPTYPFLLALGVLATLGVVARAGRARGLATGRAIDLGLWALAGGVIGARLGYVALNLEYFRDHVDEIARLSAGGLNWHGAVVGALLGLMLAGRVYRTPTDGLTDSLAFGVGLIALAGWTACGALACGYGAEVANLADHPALLVAERADMYGLVVPRYDTQRLGALLAIAVLVLTLALRWRGWLRGRRLWAALAAFSAGMFALGFLRGDPAVMVAGLRLDQGFDLGMLLLAGWGLWRWPAKEA